jgi:hypothetical protein
MQRHTVSILCEVSVATEIRLTMMSPHFGFFRINEQPIHHTTMECECDPVPLCDLHFDLLILLIA